MYLIGTAIETITSFLSNLVDGIFYSFGWVLKNEIIRSWARIFANPLALMFIAWYVNKKLAKEKLQRQKKAVQEEKNRQLEDKRRAILSDYLKQMTTLLVEHKLSTKAHDNPTAQAARALTLTTIRELDSERNQLLTNFLFEAKLIQVDKPGDYSYFPALLKGANLNSANLQGAYLSGAYLMDAYLNGTNLTRANLIDAILTDSNLYDANLIDAILSGANLYGAYLIRANLNGAYLIRANLDSAHLIDANLTDANLYGANLRSANLKGANLKGVYLEDANVEQAQFGNHQGIDEEMKTDLISRGAVFN